MKQVDRKDLLNGWLKYHDTDVDQVIATHTKEQLLSPEWFREYPVTQEQHDEWVKWAKEFIRKETKLNKAIINSYWGMIYFNTAPNIIN